MAGRIDKSYSAAQSLSCSRKRGVFFVSPRKRDRPDEPTCPVSPEGEGGTSGPNTNRFAVPHSSVRAPPRPRPPVL
jgi:hypothetical protein